jgi:stage IV sporulation protein FB
MPLDGGRLIYELLSGSIGSNKAGRTVRALAWFVSVMLTAAGVYQFLITTYNVSLVIIGLYIMIALRTARLESALMSIREIIYRRSKLVRRGIYAARDLVVMRDTLLRESLKSMDFDRFHIVYVLDDDLHIIGTYTENEIMDALAEHDEELTFGQLADIRKKSENP